MSKEMSVTVQGLLGGGGGGGGEGFERYRMWL